MKSKFSQFLKSSLFNYAQRLVIVCVFLSYAALVSAGDTYYSKMIVKVANNSTGLGKVWVTETANKAPSEAQYSPTTYESTQGIYESKNHTYYLYALANEGYLHVGWTDKEDGSSIQSGSDKGTTQYPQQISVSSINDKSPTADTRYAVFKRYYTATLYGYNAKEDQFNKAPLTIEGGEYRDNLEISTGQFENLYKLEFNHSIDISKLIVRSTKFNCELEKIGDDIVLRVKNIGTIGDDVTIDEDITISVQDEWNASKEVCGAVATLHLSVSNGAVYVTLNPAEDLTGTYTYTQYTTGNQSFGVTTSAIVKQMITSTDYSFTFSPTSRDASKYIFQKWVIKNADGTVASESSTANLSYTFSAGQSITPVFVPVGLATFIVKSEPSVTYINLQEALGRAAALKTSTGKDQTVVVTSRTGRLAQDNYTIPNGVTLLVPGESSYTEMKGDLNENHFADSGTRGVYCTLTVDDNTNITVQRGGSISVYAKLKTTMAHSQYFIAYNYGHIELGKNCNITVNSGGGLYAFGFITGDISSHITMKSGSVVYEPFTMTDWRGGTETLGNWASNGSNGAKSRVFPIGQYYIQTVEVPMTLEAGATEKVSCCVDASALSVAVNMVLIAKYNDSECLFGLGDGTSITKTYDPATDRLKFEYNGTSTSTKVKIGCMNLKIQRLFVSLDINSKDYVMPIQNNIDVDVKNTTIDVKYDVAFMPGSTVRVHDDAVINVESTANVYVYDRGARKLDAKAGYWGSGNSLLLPLDATARPGGRQYKRTEDDDLVDALLIINGDMNIYGGLYTVKGSIDDDLEDGFGGANITSEGSGKINVYNLGSATVAKQWKQGSGAQTLALTDPKLLLHNDISKQTGETKSAYTAVNQTNVSYTYYQHDGTWRLPKGGITGIKLYDKDGNEIEKILVTNPTVESVSGYLLATLEESINGVTYKYKESDFSISLEGGNVVKSGVAAIENGNKLRIPITYTVQKKHGDNPTTLIIAKSESVDFECNISMVINATEDYTPIFEVPSELNIYGRIGEETASALSIEYPVDNVIVATSGATATTSSNPKWTAAITGDGANYFQFKMGTTGNGLADAKVKFTAPSATQQKATLTLTAEYTDANEIKKSLTKEVELTGNGLTIANTLDFNNVGTITTNSGAFELLKSINSDGTITVTTVPQDPSAVLTISQVDGKWMVTPKGTGEVTVTVDQSQSGAYERKTITKTIVIVADPRPLTEVSCVIDKASFDALTADFNNVEYNDNDNDKAINFVSSVGVQSMWMAHFSSMPGTLTFTPRGDGYWIIDESPDGVVWTELLAETRLPNNQPQYFAMNQKSRKLRIMYMPASNDDNGSITGLCITPFTVHAETTKLYVPVKDGEVQSTSVVFTHSSENVTITGSEGWTIAKKISSNLGGVQNTFYKTTVTFSGGTDVAESNSDFSLTATQNDGDAATVNIGTYTFPKPLQIKSNEWVSNDDVANINGYDESEHYYHYAIKSENVKWDAERSNIVFLNVERKGVNDKVRQVVFGYDGLPDVVTFQSAATEWMIKESTDNVTFTESTEGRTVVTVDGMNTIRQPISHTSKYVRITYAGTNENEVIISNLVIKGSPSAVPSTTDLKVASSAEFSIHVMNLPSMKLRLANTTDFKVSCGGNKTSEEEFEIVLSSAQYDFLAENRKGDITINVEWLNTTKLVQDTYLEILNGQDDKVLAKVHVVGNKVITADNASNIGVNTGIPDGYTYHGKQYTGYTHHPVNLSNTFDTDKNALFDLLVVYGETTTMDDRTTNITAPTATTGSNALTPYYVYRRTEEGKGYSFVQMVENANTENKAEIDGVTETDDDGTIAIYVPYLTAELKVYMTGFCPYATTGYTKNQEGVWLFRGYSADQLELYLEDCHIFSRNKTDNGRNLSKDDEFVENFDEGAALGSGAVFVFEHDELLQTLDEDPFGVTIHTIGDNLLRSNYGNFFEIFKMRAYQISAPLHIHPQTLDHVDASKTELTFDDVWPTGINISCEEGTYDDGTTYTYCTDDYTATKRTNGFLSLQKPNGNNNAPSIDLGNAHSVVNFKGGRVELQNAQIVSPNYKTTLAISHRSGKFGGGNEGGFKLSYGIGTDDVGGTVNFYDGTTTVQSMEVAEEYRKYYLMDTKVVGKDDKGNDIVQELTTTSCLRCPSNTYIYGGSQCFMRACSHVTSKGGAPKGLDAGGNSVLLGQYVYTLNEGKTGDYTTDDVVTNGLVSSMGFPQHTAAGDMSSCVHRDYGKLSISPDDNKKLYFWVPDGCCGVFAERDAKLTTWKACMTKIEAGLNESTKGSIGGNTFIENTEEVQNFLYCKLDKDIYDIISKKDEDGNYTYDAPFKVPAVGQETLGKYTYITPTQVGDDVPGDDLSHEVSSTAGDDYTINGKIYYITTATADVWMTFTAPFNVEKIWVVETFDENRLATETTPESGKTLRETILQRQAQHNADFAAFFGVAMALGSEDPFESIFNDWREWAYEKDKFEKLTTAENINNYHLRNKYELKPYDGTNWNDSHFYLNLDGTNSDGDKLWEYVAQGNEEYMQPNWTVPTCPTTGEILLRQGETYSLLFPYCVGCWEMDGSQAKKREYWDYWSGKFLVFESTVGPHTIKGANYLKSDNSDGIFEGENDIPEGRASLRGNCTFAFMQNTQKTTDGDVALKPTVYPYSAAPNNEGFAQESNAIDILPTQSFLLLSTTDVQQNQRSIMSISRSGKITYQPESEDSDDDDVTTDGNMPTIADASDIFVLSTYEGINIAVSEPQNVSVYTANGTLLFNGWVENSVNVALMNKGVYVVVGENVSVKVIY